MKVEIEFPGSFEHNKPLAIQCGRLYVGKALHSVRLLFTPLGEIVMLVPESATKDGSVQVMKDPPEGLIGFGSEGA